MIPLQLPRSGLPFPSTIANAIAAHASQDPDRPALLAPGRQPLSYQRLLYQIHFVVQEVNRLGIGRQDRVAVVLANGPELAASFVSISAAAAFAPLNPDFRESEFTFYLESLSARALVVERGVDSPARAAAASLNVPILDLVRQTDREAGIFSLAGQARSLPATCGFTQSQDCALVLHTAGSTSRPKRVTLTQANVCAIGHNLGQTLGLSAADCCLNVMPLFHIHGLITAMLSALYAGGSVVCMPGFDADQFFSWLAYFRPSWYTTVPTIHRSIQAKASLLGQDFSRSGLRVIRSTSAPLPVSQLEDLERTFGVPVLESYGLTEASHVCCNPLPPKARKPGSVGLAAGAEVAIMDEIGRMLGPDMTGEIVIRGPNVTAGYEGDLSANEAAFRDGWFRSGDLGYRDSEGYFYVTGRIKEIINRGGEKIVPREIDETLLSHPDVAQAVTFAVPHVRLGQDVAAAVVLRNGNHASARELREFTLERLASHKVPSQVLIVDEIPKSPIGKVQRLGLHSALGHLLQPHFIAPAGTVEETLARIWCDLLGLERVGAQDNFFYLGGDSLLAVTLFAEIEKKLGKRLPPVTLFKEATIAELAKVLEEPLAPQAKAHMVEIQPRGSKRPLVFLPSLVGDIWYPRAIIKHLSTDQPVYGIQPDQKVAAFAPLEEIAAGYVELLRTFQSHGPYHLAGYSFAGLLAYAMACRLVAQGQEVAFLALIDTAARPFANQAIRPHAFLRNTLYWLLDDFLQTRPKEIVARLRRHAAAARNSGRSIFRSTPLQQAELESLFPVNHLPASYRETMEANLRASREYACKPYPGGITLLRARTRPLFRPLESDLGWSRWAGQGVDLRVVPGHHGSILREPYVRLLAGQLQDALERTQTQAAGRN